MWFADLLGWNYATEVDENLLVHLRATVRSSLAAAAATEVAPAAATDHTLHLLARWVAALAHPAAPRRPVSDAWVAALAQGDDRALLRHFRCVELQERARIEVVLAAMPEPPSRPRFQFDFATPRKGRTRLTTCYTVRRQLPGDV
jgi:hypothetical protein